MPPQIRDRELTHLDRDPIHNSPASPAIRTRHLRIPPNTHPPSSIRQRRIHRPRPPSPLQSEEIKPQILQEDRAP